MDRARVDPHAGRRLVNKLDAIMSSVLAQLELASHASAASTEGRVSHGKPGGNQPPPVSAPHLHYERVYREARTDDQRRVLIECALEELRDIRYAKRKAVVATRELRIRIGLDPAAVSIVAHRYSCSKRHVYRCRDEVRRLPRSVLAAATMCD